jgi:hypothetical protein
MPRTEIFAIAFLLLKLRRAYDAGRRGGPFHKLRLIGGAGR